MLRIERLEDRLLLAASPLGDDLHVNDSVHGVQVTSAESGAVATNNSGDLVVTFSGRGAGDRSGVFVRRLDASGDFLGTQMRVNTTIRGPQEHAAAAMADDGSHVVAWSGRGGGDRHGVFAQWFDAEGRRVGPETLINATTGGVQRHPSVAMAPDGSAVIAWSGTGPGDLDGIFMQLFDADRNRVGGQTRVNTTTANDQAFPTVAMSENGQVVISWSSRHQDGSDWGIVAQRFASDGSPQGSEFIVNSSTAGSQLGSSVTMLDQNGFVMTFSSRGPGAASWDVFARTFGPDGTAQDDAFLVNTVTEGHQRDAKIAASGDGGFFVTFSSGIPDGSGWEVIGQAFTSDGAPDGDPFQANSTSGHASGHQQFPSVAMSDPGRGVVVWSGHGIEDRHGVYAQQLRDEEANRPPVLDGIADETIDELEMLSLIVTATDPDGDGFTFSLASGPDGAVIDASSGQFNWTPTEDQGPTEATVTIRVTDDGTPPLSDTATFLVTVNEVNRPPDLGQIEDATISEGDTISFTAIAEDPDIPGNKLTFILDPEDTPAGAVIDPDTGEFSWTPSEDQGLGTFTVTVLVIDDGQPPLSDSETLIISVSEENRPPDLAPILDVTISPGETISFTAMATDPDIPPNELTYILDPENAPAGATMDPATGEFSWTPSQDQRTESFTATVLVIDDGQPPLSDAETFTISVGNLRSPRAAGLRDEKSGVDDFGIHSPHEELTDYRPFDAVFTSLGKLPNLPEDRPWPTYG